MALFFWRQEIHVPGTLAVDTDDLGRTYRIRERGGGRRTLEALDGVDLHVREGELFGLLGPNGAGKTTLIKILTTLLAPTAGTARVAGYDVTREADRVRPLINIVSGGEASGYGLLTVRENLWMFAQFYGMASGEANRRIRELLQQLSMLDRINTKSSQLSTGLRQKMNIVRGFLTDPQVLFLDEPTLGLDVGASRDIRVFVRRWMQEDPSRTVMLTTHHMVEADELCDRVAIINAGKVLACDTPAALKRNLRSESIFHVETMPLDGSGVGLFKSVSGVRTVTRRERDDRTELELVMDEERVIGGVLSAMDAHGVRLLSLTKREPTLEDVFVSLVGHRMGDEDQNNGRAS
jgi:ABC-2 type transport system ATP-binding protein